MCRKDAAVNMEGQFLVRQIYDDEITYNIISAAVNRLSTYYYINVYISRIKNSFSKNYKKKNTNENMKYLNNNFLFDVKSFHKNLS